MASFFRRLTGSHSPPPAPPAPPVPPPQQPHNNQYRAHPQYHAQEQRTPPQHQTQQRHQYQPVDVPQMQPAVASWISSRITISPYHEPGLHPGHFTALNAGGSHLLQNLLAFDSNFCDKRNAPVNFHTLWGHIAISDYDGRLVCATTRPGQSEPALQVTPQEMRQISANFDAGPQQWESRGVIVQGKHHIFIRSVPVAGRISQPEFLQKQFLSFLMGTHMPVGKDEGECSIGMLSQDVLREVLKHLLEGVDFPKIGIATSRATKALIIAKTRRCIVVGSFPNNMCPDPQLSCGMQQIIPFLDAMVECGW